MQIRKINSADIKVVTPWYLARGDDFLTDFCPMETGFVVEDTGTLIAVGFLLMTNSKLCFMEYLQTNNNESVAKQGKAIILLTKFLEKLSKELGFKVILGLTPEDHLSLAQHYERRGALFGKKLMRLIYKRLY